MGPQLTHQTGENSPPTSPPVDSLVQCPLLLSTPSIMPVLDLPTTPRARMEPASTTVLSMSTRRLWPLTVSVVSTVVSSFLPSFSDGLLLLCLVWLHTQLIPSDDA